MVNLQEVKTIVSSLNEKNKKLILIDREKTRIINELMERVDELEEELDYQKKYDGVKRLVLKRNVG